ncbi:MAG: YifB family Mg chelatase-like AAA ATPase [Opitutales bacterium]
MLAVVQSGALVGVEASPVHVEVNVGEVGEPRTVIVGLPDTAVKEANDRVKSALMNTGFRAPKTHTTVNLAPGDLRKEGPLYELPLALGLLAATEQLKPDGRARLPRFLIAGELSLSGATRAVRGGLAMAVLAREQQLDGILLPPRSAEEAALVEGITVYPVTSLDETVRFLEGEVDLTPLNPESSPYRRRRTQTHAADFSEVKGQAAVRRAVEIAVAGEHNILLIGPPGSGKSMIAKRIPTIMPEPSLDEFLEVLSIQSAAGITLNGDGRYFERPFRAPHSTISDAGLLGGGIVPGPGEISLAHNGVLFLDELPEFKRSTLEVLRQPLEDGVVTISRSAGKVTLPCSFMLVAAMNPTPDGYSGKDGQRRSQSTPAQIQKYRNRISGPLLDRIDIHMEAPALSVEELRQAQPGEDSCTLRARVMAARERQHTRFSIKRDSNGDIRVRCNARMNHSQIRKHCALGETEGQLLQQAMERLKLSARAYDRILKVARTIADLASADTIGAPHLLEAIQYRSLDRQVWGG